MKREEDSADHPADFLPHVLRDYAFIADGQRGALIGPRGDLAWLCFPRWDSDAVFASLIGGDSLYAITPTHPFVWGGYYEEGSLIWRSHWITGSSVIECRETLAFPGESGRAVILRRVEAIQGDAQVRVLLHLRAGFDAEPTRALHNDDGMWTARAGGLYLRWLGGAGAEITPDGHHGHRLSLTIDVRAGTHHDLVLELSTAALPCPPDGPALWHSTESAWRDIVPPLTGAIAPRDVRHSYAVLAGLTSPGGGMVAAATMSLPERAEAGRNYDYRYVWIRDQSYTGQAIAADGPHPLLDAALCFVTERVLADGPGLKPAYTVCGGNVPDQRALELPGYPGGFDRVGNWVNRQFQLDAFGEALLLFAAGARHDHLGADGWQAVETAVSAIRQRWGDPDAGIWEIDDQAWTHSRLICVAGLRAVAAARMGSGPAVAATWSTLADQIAADTARTSLHPSGRWQRSPGDQRLDAALLLPPIRGAMAANDPRTVATLEAYLDELADEGFGYRFRHDQRPLGAAEGAFLLCGFVTALSLHQQGETLAGMRWFERNRGACGQSGLFSEEYDITQRQLRGNLPQAFVHALMIEAACRLAEPWSQATPATSISLDVNQPFDVNR
ncbi:MAG TPA: glycoside hydrolase family 15 protein [Acidimicrobiales bacterium]|nr:glycoside hydrolase family 15 protein [Acidimicrobiales bacterium]